MKLKIKIVKKEAMHKRRFARQENGVLYLNIPAKCVDGSNIIGVMHERNGTTTQVRGDLFEVILNILEHEILHRTIEKHFNPHISSLLDKSKYTFQEARKVNKLR